MPELVSYAVVSDPGQFPFAAAPIYDGRVVLAMEQCNPLRDPQTEHMLAAAGYEPDPCDPSLYRSLDYAPSKAVRAIPLQAPTEIMHPSGRPQRVRDGWIVQRLDDPDHIFLVPSHEFASHYIARAS